MKPCSASEVGVVVGGFEGREVGEIPRVGELMGAITSGAHPDESIKITILSKIICCFNVVRFPAFLIHGR